MKEVAGYFARLLSWYTKGGLTDEYGKWHESGHHYKIAYLEVLNEIEFEHSWDPAGLHEVLRHRHRRHAQGGPRPEIHVHSRSALPARHPDMFEYFLNPANHHGGAPLDFITYHFYAVPAPEETIDQWQYTFFDQAEGFLNTVHFAEEIRKKKLSLSTKTGPQRTRRHLLPRG